MDAAPRTASRLCRRLREAGIQTRRVKWDARGDPAWPVGGVTLLVVDRERGADAERLARALVALAARGVSTLVWGLPESVALPAGVAIERIPETATVDEVVGRLQALRRYAPLVRDLDSELHRLHKLGEQMARYVGEIDEEMRLAGQLQADLLPQRFPTFPGLYFASIYRPASWVSGDLFDVFPIDEEHVGLFVADAMGHGTAAALMTMLLRQIISTGRQGNDRQDLLRPASLLTAIHQAVARQNLPHSQYVTAVYGVLDAVTRELRLARGAHPFPIRVHRDGRISELAPQGGLLGFSDVATGFEEQVLELEVGDKLILYTDGLEDALLASRDPLTREAIWSPQLLSWARYGADEFVRSLTECLDRREGSLHPADDMTLLLVELQPA